MPAGPDSLGFVYFAATKLCGYTAFSHYAIAPQARKSLALQLSVEDLPSPFLPSSWKAGAIRAAIGVAIGAVVGFAYWNIPSLSNTDLFDNGLFFALLIPVRILEWWLLLRWIYGECALSSRQKTALITGGILTSFALDAIGILSAFILPGGAWVC